MHSKMIEPLPERFEIYGTLMMVFCRVDGLLDDETGTACSSDVTLANTGILNYY